MPLRHPAVLCTLSSRTACSRSVVLLLALLCVAPSRASAQLNGDGSRAGCTAPGCLIFTSLAVTQPGGVGDDVFTYPGVSNMVTSQNHTTACCTAAPPDTWGQAESRYR